MALLRRYIACGAKVDQYGRPHACDVDILRGDVPVIQGQCVYLLQRPQDGKH
ncbi:hypothetical protein MBAV_003382 [Candidatus Magnetobacterium bavaricum]|uniref:Uncharacterized protein n=1 Tax=Candidatus Magnetobacterium bavaricum TaxID=29290 RepID=A0A0F3GR48_9BACT|nr:hypothetical protein MBAV_003382 [Candidatus Magnetobacterium bavaricum]